MPDSPAPEVVRQQSSGSIRQVARIAFPLIMAASSHAVKLFTDRAMLAQYTSEALTASFAAGLTCFTMAAVFIGVGGYTNAFVAQYTGAGKEDGVGRSVWLGIYVALAGGLLLAVSSLFGQSLFGAIGHASTVQRLEVRYYAILNSGAVFFLLLDVILSFWSGRGKTWVVFWISFATCALNVGLNYMLIFGKLGMPRLGINGAAIGTIFSNLGGVVLALSLFLRSSNRLKYNTLPARTFDFSLFVRLIRFGLPNGIQLLLDIAAFNVFVQVMGKMGRLEGEAATIAFSINTIAFIPMLGLGRTTTILVGQAIGAKDIPLAWRSVASSRFIVICYMTVLCLAFGLFPRSLVSIFSRSGDHSQLQALAMAENMLYFIAAYLLFDGLLIIYSGAIKGAGDTRFAMWVSVSLSWALMAGPSIVGFHCGWSIWVIWSFLVVAVIVIALVFYLRFRTGKWTRMRIIEPA